MADGRKQSGISAPPGAWKLLGELLEGRRQALGYRYRTQFERERKLNKRMQADIEKAYEARINTFPAGTLRHIAEVYEVTYESLTAVLAGKADELAPAAPAVPAEPPGWAPPVDDAGRYAAGRPYADRIWERLRALAAGGVTGPSGDQVFGAGSADAKAWDAAAGRLDDADRVWHVADLQRRGAARRAGSPAASPRARGT